MKTFILGAGPAGLALADGLTETRTHSFTLIERDDMIGGLARTVPWKSYGNHDLGPHKIFSLDPELVRRVEGLLPSDQWLTREKKSSIYMKGHYLPYPPSPFSLLGVYGIQRFVKMVKDYGVAQVKTRLLKSDPKTFKDDMEMRVGNGLYEGLFEPIAKKLWGDPAHLDSKLSKGRVQTPSPAEVILRLLKIQQSSQFEALTFRYPKGGLQNLWKSIEKKSEGRGQILRSTEVVRLEHDGKYVSKIVTKDLATGAETATDVEKDDYVVSSLPMGLLPKLFSPAPDERISKLVRDYVHLNDLILVFFKINRAQLMKDSWVFIPDPDIVFHRLSEQESFDPGMSPEGSIVCCEVMSNENRPMSASSDEELGNLCREGLKKMGYAGFEIQDTRVMRLPRSYPVFRPGYESALKSALEFFDSFENFKTIGRQGAFNYIGTMDCMDIGYGAARWLATAGRRVPWLDERSRTNHYPVLD